MINLIAMFCVCANFFFAGYYFSKNYKWADTVTERFYCILWCLGTMIFGCAYIIISFLLSILFCFFKDIDRLFQVSFWFAYFFTRKYYNLEKRKLEKINRIAINIRNTKNIKDKIYRYCTTLVNKRNNYIHVEPDKPTF